MNSSRRRPSSALGSCRYKLQEDDLPEITRRLADYDIGYLLLIGGNDTMDTILRIEDHCHRTGYRLCGVGVPKTVDNDLYGTDHTPGYGSAARYVALSVLQGGRLACDMQRVDRYAVYQTVGRTAGWLAAAAALAKRRPQDAPPTLSICPERRVSRTALLVDVRDTIERYGWCYIVVGEGALWEDGSPISTGEGPRSLRQPGIRGDGWQQCRAQPTPHHPRGD